MRRLLATALLCTGFASAERRPDFLVQTPGPERWQALLGSLGLKATAAEAPYRIVIGDSAEARSAGFEPTAETVRVASVVDRRDPELAIYWQEPLELPVYRLPEGAKVFAHEKRTEAPLMAGLEREQGGLLWLAAPPGESGYDRFPYIVQALVDLGLRPPFRGSRLWVFFDASYRLRVDPDYLAQRWREAGVSAIHAAAWTFYDPDPQRDEYLRKLIAACHRQAVLVYAWLELPHVSENFWAGHPACREKTAGGQDAQLDWRKLVNLADPECFATVEQGLRRMLSAFEWDGVNLAELYFESLHGPDDPARFTPLNEWVRADARTRLGFDPLDLFDPASPRFWSRDQAAWRAFVDYRAELALELQRRWLEVLADVKPQAHLVVTQIEDRFDDRMRDFLGADAAALLPLAEKLDFVLLIEDPATLWDLGPERYPEIARRYEPLTPDPDRIAIDINIVERYQQTYPTRKQTGGELFRLVHTAVNAFPRTALYFEHSIPKPDWELLRSATTTATLEELGPPLRVSGNKPFGLAWAGDAAVDGALWPITDGETVWLPAGSHSVAAAAELPPARVTELNGDLLDASVEDGAVRFSYRAEARAIALVDRRPARLEIDGAVEEPQLLEARRHWALLLPRGRHEVRLSF